jgi:hypothetical protein
MPLLRKANESQQSDWRPVPEGLWRWEIGEPEVVKSEKFNNYQVKFPLLLTSTEKDRLENEVGDTPAGVQQSWRTTYRTGLSLGFVDRTGQYKSTKLVDFLAACFGSKQQRKFREWIAAGGGPDTAGLDNVDDEINAILDWLKWWQGLEVYGTISHRTGSDGRVWADFAGPMSVGSLPGQRDDDYQSVGLGKLRAMMAETGRQAEAPAPVVAPASPTPQLDAAKYTELFGDDEEEQKAA